MLELWLFLKNISKLRVNTNHELAVVAGASHMLTNLILSTILWGIDHYHLNPTPGEAEERASRCWDQRPEQICEDQSL